LASRASSAGSDPEQRRARDGPNRITGCATPTRRRLEHRDRHLLRQGCEVRRRVAAWPTEVPRRNANLALFGRRKQASEPDRCRRALRERDRPAGGVRCPRSRDYLRPTDLSRCSFQRPPTRQARNLKREPGFLVTGSSSTSIDPNIIRPASSSPARRARFDCSSRVVSPGAFERSAWCAAVAGSLRATRSRGRPASLILLGVTLPRRRRVHVHRPPRSGALTVSPGLVAIATAGDCSFHTATAP